MKKLLFIFALFIIACGQQKSSPKAGAANGDTTAVHMPTLDTLQVAAPDQFVTGRFDYRTHPDFVELPSQYAYADIYLQKETFEAFKKMFDAAQKDGINLAVISGTRSFSEQKAIWERKWESLTDSTGLQKARNILQFSSMPMTSRHHWGTDIDINDLNNSYFESGQGKKEYQWLKAHANDFGFYQPYTDKSVNGRTGYNEEKWHWSYMPLASRYLAYYNGHITNADISGFEGAGLADEIDMVKNYVNGISVKMKKYELRKVDSK